MHQVTQIEAAMQRVQGRRAHEPSEREREIIDVTVKNVELGRPLERLGELDDVPGTPRPRPGQHDG